ncbi:MAG: sigma 54-interacting transcriptional regulator [Bacteroidia bacterium]|nr:sigma 54-interacting transcriptional regulator [Bacteroidia bacterium]
MTIQQVKQRYGIIGNSPAINTAVEIATQVAPTEVTVLITGENGTGKDIFPRIVHQYSKRRHKKFMAINTGAIPEGTLDSELFGHEKGSFTSAIDSRKGYFEEVEDGTIFMDEVGEMPLATQARLLRMLENGEYLRVGSSNVRNADVRVIAATNKNLVDMIRNGRFREDLFFRLNTVNIHIPPLRERGEDIELLFNYFALHFGEKYQREPVFLAEDAIPLLYKYRWPGNVRELRNLVEKLTVLVKGDMVTATVLQKNLLIPDSYLPAIINFNGAKQQTDSTPLEDPDKDMLFRMISTLGKEVAELKHMFRSVLEGRPVDLDDDLPMRNIPQRSPGYDELYAETLQEAQIVEHYQPGRPVTPLLEESLSLEKKEKELIIKALTKHNNNRKKAATELGISERTLYRKIKNYDINL